MAGKSKAKTNTKITENIDLVKRNEELERELEELKKKIETLMSEKVSAVEKNNDIKDENEVFPEIPMNKPIKVMSLYTGGLNLKKYDSDKTPVRFNRFGEVQPILYMDLIKIISHKRNFYEERIKVNYLEKDIEKILDKNTIEKVLDYENEKIRDLFVGTTKQIRQTIIDLIIDKIIKKEYVDRNKVALISELYGKDLYEIAE